jgi:hypothetical protein
MSFLNSTKTVDPGAWLHRLTGLQQPFHERKQKIEQKANLWFTREMARPGSQVSTEPPSVVTEALNKIEREQLHVQREFFASIEVDIHQELERRLSAISRSYESVAEAFDDLRRFEGQVGELARRCGRFTPESLADPHVTVAGFQAWRNHALRILHPPAAAALGKAAAMMNPLELDE